MRLQLTAGAARRIQLPVPLWLAAIRLNATASDKTARYCQEKVRIRPVPVSVVRRRSAIAWQTFAAGPQGDSAVNGYDAVPVLYIAALRRPEEPDVADHGAGIAFDSKTTPEPAALRRERRSANAMRPRPENA
jgi:hypothetical protein